MNKKKTKLINSYIILIRVAESEAKHPTLTLSFQSFLFQLLYRTWSLAVNNFVVTSK